MSKYEELAVAFNTARIEYQNELLSSSEMYHILTDVVGFGRDSSLLSLLTKKDIIRRVGRNEYTFTESPVYYGKIQVIMTIHHHKQYIRYNKRTPERAASYLRNQGYVVYKKK